MTAHHGFGDDDQAYAEYYGPEPGERTFADYVVLYAVSIVFMLMAAYFLMNMLQGIWATLGLDLSTVAT